MSAAQELFTNVLRVMERPAALAFVRERLAWDRRTQAPPKSLATDGRMMAIIAGETHDAFVDARVERAIESAMGARHDLSLGQSLYLERLGRESLGNDVLDTLELARRYLIIPSYSLESVAQYLSVPQPVAHRAMADVETTRQVFLKLVERAQKRGYVIDTNNRRDAAKPRSSNARNQLFDITEKRGKSQR